MNVGHALQYANWHTKRQVPNDTLRKMPIGPLIGRMAFEFQTALKWHMDRHGTKIVDLVSATGISRDVLNKLLTRDNASTTAERAVIIASYFGKTVNQFILCQEVSPSEMAQNLFQLLLPEDQQLLQAQILGILRARGIQPA